MRTIIIGEIGNNWQSKKDILASIEFLRSRGCLIKMQSHQGEFEHLKDYVIPKDWMVEWKANDIFYSVFTRGMVDFLEKFVDPKFYKIASRSYTDTKLIHNVIKTHKKIFVSVPYPKNIHFIGNRNKEILKAMLFHCVPEYPAVNAHLEVFDTIYRYDGFSDHTTSTIVPALAVMKGAKIIEKHFKVRDMNTPDSPHSLLPEQWDMMIENINEAERNMEV